MATIPTPLRAGLETDAGGNYPSQLNQRELRLLWAALKNKNLEDTFRQALVVSNFDDAAGTIYTGDAAEVLGFDSGLANYEVYQAAVASAAVVAPYQSADGLELQPVAAGDALELSNGITSLSRCAFTVGTDAEFFWEATVKIDDISDVTEIFAGFRKAAAYTADPDDYTDMAAFHVGATDDGRISLATILNDAATTMTDTTESDWTDGGSHTLRVEVNRLGQVKFLYDGEEPAATIAFTFDSGDVVIPFLHLNTETGDPGVSISSWRCGKK
jgi:hypothetical protein